MTVLVGRVGYGTVSRVHTECTLYRRGVLYSVITVCRFYRQIFSVSVTCDRAVHVLRNYLETGIWEKHSYIPYGAHTYLGSSLSHDLVTHRSFPVRHVESHGTESPKAVPHILRFRRAIALGVLQPHLDRGICTMALYIRTEQIW